MIEWQWSSFADLTAARADLDQLRQTTVADLAKMG